MAKDFELSGDINTDIKTDACDKSSDFNSDLAKEDGVDLNVETSARDRIIMAGYDGLNNPSDIANITAAFRSPPGAEDVYAQMAQATWNMGVAGSRELMVGVNETYGNPAGELQNIRIQQAIEEGANAAGNPDALADNEPVYDPETGDDLTDEKFRKQGE